MLCKEIPFIGPFKHVIPKFIEFKRGLGYDCRKAMVYRLAEIDRFFYERGITEVSIPEEIYMEWAIKRPKEGNSNRIRRIGVLSGFARYLHDCDYEGRRDAVAARVVSGTARPELTRGPLGMDVVRLVRIRIDIFLVIEVPLDLISGLTRLGPPQQTIGHVALGFKILQRCSSS